jgi:hypothetical protein
MREDEDRDLDEGGRSKNAEAERHRLDTGARAKDRAINECVRMFAPASVRVRPAESVPDADPVLNVMAHEAFHIFLVSA